MNPAETLPVSAVIVVKNAAKTIGRCLDSVRLNRPAEIIIVDGLSSDSTLDIARAFTDRIFSDGGRGVSAAHQLGLEQAAQPCVSFIDADIMLPEGALEAMLAELRGGGFANVQASIVPYKSDTYWERSQDEEVRSRRSRVSGGLSACVLDKAKALETGFDPAVRIAGDDLDFLYRLKSAGYTACNSCVTAVHEHRTGFKGLVRQRFWYGRAKPALIRKHGLRKPELWAPAVMACWLMCYTATGRFHMLPYTLVCGLADSAGMVKGIFEMGGKYRHHGTYDNSCRRT